MGESCWGYHTLALSSDAKAIDRILNSTASLCSQHDLYLSSRPALPLLFLNKYKSPRTSKGEGKNGKLARRAVPAQSPAPSEQELQDDDDGSNCDSTPNSDEANHDKDDYNNCDFTPVSGESDDDEDHDNDENNGDFISHSGESDEDDDRGGCYGRGVNVWGEISHGCENVFCSPISVTVRRKRDAATRVTWSVSPPKEYNDVTPLS